MNKPQMLESVRRFLSQFGKPDEKILKAMEQVDRKNFMPDDLAGQSYIDTAMPIGSGQTISQPSTVARMLQLLELRGGDKVLEVGAGSGWNAGLIGFLVGSHVPTQISQPSVARPTLCLVQKVRQNKLTGELVGDEISDKVAKFAEGNVLTLEIVEQLIERAKKKLKKFKNVEIRKENFRKLKEKFDKVVFTAGIIECDEGVIKDFAEEHLNDEGILVCPYQYGPLIVIKKVNGKIVKSYTDEEYVFVPLVL